MKTDGCNCREQPGLTGVEKELPCPLSRWTAGRKATGHPVCLVKMAHVTLESATIADFIAFLCSFLKFPSLGGSYMFVKRTRLSCPATPQLSSHPSSLLESHSISVSVSWISDLGHALSMSSHSPTTANRFPGQVIRQVRGGKEVVHAVCNQLPLHSSSYLALCHWLLSDVVSSTVCPYPGTHPCHMYNQWSHIVYTFLCQNVWVFFSFWDALFENYPSLEFHSASTATCSEGL